MSEAATIFSPRQLELCKLLVRGMSVKQMMRATGLGHGTIKVHLNSARRKVGADNAVQLAVWFVRDEAGLPQPKAPEPVPAPKLAPEPMPTPEPVRVWSNWTVIYD